jgi:hypothetical protein
MNGWQSRGAPDIRQAARVRAQEILSTHYPAYIDPVTDAKLRERLPILLRGRRYAAGQSAVLRPAKSQIRTMTSSFWIRYTLAAISLKPATSMALTSSEPRLLACR